jgi:hypothetical protein
MTEISDEAWLELVDYLGEIEAGDEIQFAALTDRERGLGENELIPMLDRAAELGMIRQTDSRTWAKREPVIDTSPREEE